MSTSGVRCLPAQCRDAVRPRLLLACTLLARSCTHDRVARRSASGPSWRRPTSWSAAAGRASACLPGRPAAPSASGCSRWASSPGCCARPPAWPAARSARSSPPTCPARSRWASAARSASSARSLAAPLILGNTVLAKPSEESPFVGGLLWGEIFAEAGLPDGVLNIVTHAPGEAGPIGEELVEHPAVRRINFTGSTATGRKLAEAAGRNLKRVVLELGGDNPLLVLDDADLDYAVDASAFGAYLHQGQICMSARRLLVDRRIADDYLDRLAAKTAGLTVGDPAVPGTVIGPLINQRALDTVEGRVREAVAGGAKVLAGGERVGNAFQATLLADVPADSELVRVETFGPVATVEVVDGADEAVARANATAYGLAAGVLTGDPDRGLAVADRLQAGIVHVNDQPVGDEPQMPFGGVKDSGWGRFGGQAAVDEFTELRWVTVQSGTRPFPF